MVTTDQVRSGSLKTVSLDVELSKLRAQLDGELVLPGDAEYDSARKTVAFLMDRYPLCIVRAATEHDIVAGVNFARENDLPLSVRSGGHHLGHMGVIDDAVAIDLSQMKQIRIDPVARIARVQPGANSRELGEAANQYGLALTTGDTFSVGLGGLVTGGGLGFMARAYGLTIDSLISARVVTADGSVNTASAIENPDLFWAIRGGGGNFGIVTEFTFRMAPVGDILGGELVLPATREVIRGYLELALAAPDELTTISALLHIPPFPHVPEEFVGTTAFQILVTWTGDPEEGQRVMAPFRALATPLIDNLNVMPYPEIYKLTEHFAAPHGAAIRSMFTDDFSDQVLDDLLDGIRNASSPFSLIQLRPLGGEYGRVDKNATAFPHRDRNHFLAIIGVWLDPADDPAVHRSWTQAIWDKVQSEGDGVYVNFLENEGPERIRAAYGETNWERLIRIKQHYDPTNLFRYNQNITPAN